jgi:hypothetical protein
VDVRITNTTRSTELASDARIARSYWARLAGLLGRGSLRPGEALVIEPCNSVHTAFMRFTIDVLYIDRERRVAKAVNALRPFRVSAALREARSVIELPAGVIAATGTAVGDQLQFDS